MSLFFPSTCFVPFTCSNSTSPCWERMDFNYIIKLMINPSLHLKQSLIRAIKKVIRMKKLSCLPSSLPPSLTYSSLDVIMSSNFLQFNVLISWLCSENKSNTSTPSQPLSMSKWMRTIFTQFTEWHLTQGQYKICMQLFISISLLFSLQDTSSR